jgi:hypothetical protein
MSEGNTLGIATPADLTAKYLVEDTELGSGATCSVYMAINKVILIFFFNFYTLKKSAKHLFQFFKHN